MLISPTSGTKPLAADEADNDDEADEDEADCVTARGVSVVTIRKRKQTGMKIGIVGQKQQIE